jgi:tetratricopeptide (TPR) repeat protein
MMERTRFISAFALLSLLWALPTAAQPSELGLGEQRPWAAGVSLEDQQAAEVLFREGNSQMKAALFVKAADTYRQALQHWSHPAIHFNRALALQTLNKPLELHVNLEEALRYEGAPLDETKRNRARQLKALVEQQVLTRLEVTCDVPGSIVKMGEELLCKAPASFVRWALPGEVVFTATKAGYPDHIRNRTLRAGQTVPLDFKMYTEEELTRRTQRWAAWKPWAVVGAGAALAAGGGLFYRQAQMNHRSFDAQVEKDKYCRDCRLTPEVTAMRTRGDRMQKLASGAYAVGGTAIVTGAVLLYANRGKSRLVGPDEHEREMNLAPVFGEQTGVVMTLRY